MCVLLVLPPSHLPVAAQVCGFREKVEGSRYFLGVGVRGTDPGLDRDNDSSLPRAGEG